jgi:hypothetical protein
VTALFEEAQKHLARFVAGEEFGHMSLSLSQPLSQRLATEARRHRDSDKENRGGREALKQALPLPCSGCKTCVLSRLENWKWLKWGGLSGVLIAVSRLESG